MSIRVAVLVTPSTSSLVSLRVSNAASQQFSREKVSSSASQFALAGGSRLSVEVVAVDCGDLRQCAKTLASVLPQAIVLAFDILKPENGSANFAGLQDAENLWRETVASQDALRGASVILLGCVEEEAMSAAGQAIDHVRERAVPAATRISQIHRSDAEYVECVLEDEPLDAEIGFAGIRVVFADVARMVLDAAASGMRSPASPVSAPTSKRPTATRTRTADAGSSAAAQSAGIQKSGSATASAKQQPSTVALQKDSSEKEPPQRRNVEGERLRARMEEQRHIPAPDRLAAIFSEFRVSYGAIDAGELIRDILSHDDLRLEVMREFRLRNHSLISLLSQRSAIIYLLSSLHDDTIETSHRGAASELLTADVPAILDAFVGDDSDDTSTAPLWPELFRFVHKLPSITSAKEFEVPTLSPHSTLLCARVAGFLVATRALEFVFYVQQHPLIVQELVERLGTSPSCTSLIMEMLEAEQQLRNNGLGHRGSGNVAADYDDPVPRHKTMVAPLPIAGSEEEDVMPDEDDKASGDSITGLLSGSSPSVSSSWLHDSLDVDPGHPNDPVMIASVLVPALTRILRFIAKKQLHMYENRGKPEGKSGLETFFNASSAFLASTCDLCTHAVNKFPVETPIVHLISGRQFSCAVAELALAGAIEGKDSWRSFPLSQAALELALLMTSLCANDSDSYEIATLPPMLEALITDPESRNITYLKRIKEMLSRPPRGLPATVETTAGVTAPLGVLRLRLLEMVGLMLRCGFERVDQALMQHKVLPSCVNLFFQYRWNNVMHAVQLVAWKRVLTSAEPSRFPIILHLLKDCNLFERILQVEQGHRQEVALLLKMERSSRVHVAGAVSAAPRSGYMGHVQELAACVVGASVRHARMYYFLEDHPKSAEWHALIRSLRERQQYLASAGVPVPRDHQH